MKPLLPVIEKLLAHQEELIARPNVVDSSHYNGIYSRYERPVLSRHHVPVDWRYDLNPSTNPWGLERLGVNAVFNAGAIELDGYIYLMARIEGHDRKSFFGLARSRTGIDGFRFVGGPIVLPETEDPDINVYDMRLVKHEDGWIYGLFCTERKDPVAPPEDTSSAVAQCGVARTRNLVDWERLPDFQSPSPQQRNVVLHPKFVQGKYAFYTRPQQGFIDTGKGGGIGWGLSDSMSPARISQEEIIQARSYHTVYELKNGQGAAPIETPAGWLHIAHGVRACATGLRYVLYSFLTDLQEPNRLLHVPSGYFLAAEGAERLGDLANVIFSNGLVSRSDGSVLLYYASGDTILHVASTTMDRLVDYATRTEADPGRSAACVEQRRALWQANADYLS